MLYEKKIVKVPLGFKIGANVYISGEGDEVFQIEAISKNTEGEVVEIVSSSGCREALCKYCLVDSRGYNASWDNEDNQIFVSIGECDVCGKTFPDSCVFHRNEDDEKSMVCPECHNKKTKKKRKGRIIGRG